MNTSSDMLAASQIRAEVVEPTPISPARLFLWSVRRELWENRSIYLAPIAVGAVSILGFAISAAHLPAEMRGASALDPMKQHAVIEQRFMIVALMLMLTEILVAAFYCLDALYSERRDRSLLFWKSLPVSDLMVVLSKASIPILVIPLVVFAVTVATQFTIMLIGSAVLAGSGMNGEMLWSHMPFIKMSAIHLYHLVVFHGIWYAPFYAWLLMVSAWAKRTPLLWAVFPPLAIGLFEKFAFNTSYFGMMLLNRFTGGEQPSDKASGVGMMTMDMFAPEHPGHILMDPGLWIGLAITAAFLFAAARLRRSRGVI
jgi:ABC-2 type transport system permease protein